MKKWEYTYRKWNYLSPGAIEMDIKKLGDEGWKLRKVIACGNDNNHIVAFFEREKVIRDPAKEGPFTVPPETR